MFFKDHRKTAPFVVGNDGLDMKTGDRTEDGSFEDFTGIQKGAMLWYYNSLTYGTEKLFGPLHKIIVRRDTASCQLRLEARVDPGDQTTEFIPFEVTSTAIFSVFYLLSGINLHVLISTISTRF